MIFLPALWQLRPTPIQGYVGANGSGKTAMAVTDAIALSKNKTLISNIAINPPPENNTTVIRLTSLSQLAWFEQRKNPDGSIWFDENGMPKRELHTIKNAHILIDEAQFIFNSRDTLAVPREIQGLLASLRHHQLTFAWTTPTLGMMEVQIRRVTQSVIAMKSLWGKKIEGEYWPRTLLSAAVQYDLRSTIDEELTETTPRMTDGWVTMKSLAVNNYDSFEDVQMIDDHLVCEYCGKTHRREYASHGVGEHPKNAS